MTAPFTFHSADPFSHNPFWSSSGNPSNGPLPDAAPSPGRPSVIVMAPVAESHGAASTSTLLPAPVVGMKSSTSPRLAEVEQCSVIVVGLWDSPRLLTQIQKLLRQLQQHCGPIRAAHRFSVKPPLCLLRAEYPGVVLAVTFVSPAAAAAALVTAESGWDVGAHGFRITPMQAFRLSPEEAEDCRKTFMPKDLMLYLRQATHVNPACGVEPYGYLSPPHHCQAATEQRRPGVTPSSRHSGNHASSRASNVDLESHFNYFSSFGCHSVEEGLIRANSRWGISEKLWFALCSELSWYARVMDWKQAEDAAARGDAIVIDEECLCSVFNYIIRKTDTWNDDNKRTTNAMDSTSTGQNAAYGQRGSPAPSIYAESGVLDPFGGSSATLSIPNREQPNPQSVAFDALAAMQKQYVGQSKKDRGKSQRHAPVWKWFTRSEDSSSPRDPPLSGSAISSGSTTDTKLRKDDAVSLPQVRGVVPRLLNWLLPGLSTTLLATASPHPSRYRSGGSDDGADLDSLAPAAQRRRTEGATPLPMLLPFAAPAPPPLSSNGSASLVDGVFSDSRELEDVPLQSTPYWSDGRKSSATRRFPASTPSPGDVAASPPSAVARYAAYAEASRRYRLLPSDRPSPDGVSRWRWSAAPPSAEGGVPRETNSFPSHSTADGSTGLFRTAAPPLPLRTPPSLAEWSAAESQNPSARESCEAQRETPGHESPSGRVSAWGLPPAAPSKSFLPLPPCMPLDCSSLRPEGSTMSLPISPVRRGEAPMGESICLSNGQRNSSPSCYPSLLGSSSLK